MAKKSGLLNLYFIGMVLIVVGFCLPMFGVGGNLFQGGLKTNGWNYIKFSSNTGFTTIGALCIIAGAILGLVSCFVSLGNDKMMKMLGILISIVGGIILIIGFNQNPLTKAIAKGFLKCAKVGFYTVLAGWVCGILGYLSSK